MLPLRKSDWCKLVGVDDHIEALDWTASVQVPVSLETQGMRVLAVELRQGYDGSATGVNHDCSLYIYFFMGDPEIAAGTDYATLTRSQINRIVGKWDAQDLAWEIVVHNLDADDCELAWNARCGNAVGEGICLPRMADGELYVAAIWLEKQSELNDLAGDDEDLYVRLIYQ